MKLYNSLSHKKEEFVPIKKDENKKEIWIYTCGPTVYHYVTIGNWRTYILGDFLVRALEFLYSDYVVKYVMNITDVGHLTGDNEGDSSTGEDRMEKAERREGKDAWEIAKFYTDDFLQGMKGLNMRKPDVYCRATDHIKEQIRLVKRIEAEGFAYEISDGIYFDVLKYESAGNKYGELSNLDKLKEGARVAINKEKKDPRDFALWKFSPKDEKRHMEWDSPWGKGFPGWHVECSAMSMKYLGEQFDIHIGGEDLKSTHHPCEIAQAESVTGKKPFVKYWVHGAFITVDGRRMGKSLGNAYTLKDINEYKFKDKKGDWIDTGGKLKLNIRALKLFYYGSHYRKKQNFTWEGFEVARLSLGKIIDKVKKYSQYSGGKPIDKYINLFGQKLEDDLNMPEALAVFWDLVKSPVDRKNEESDYANKWATIKSMDRVLGLGIEDLVERRSVPPEVEQLLERRKKARSDKNWEESDEIRDELLEKYRIRVKDGEKGQTYDFVQE